MRKRKMGDLDGLEKPKRAFWGIGASWDEMRLHYLNGLRKEGVRDRSRRLVGLLTSVKVATVLQGLGVTVDMTKLEAGATVMVTGAVATALNWAKVRLKINWL